MKHWSQGKFSSMLWGQNHSNVTVKRDASLSQTSSVGICYTCAAKLLLKLFIFQVHQIPSLPLSVHLLRDGWGGSASWWFLSWSTTGCAMSPTQCRCQRPVRRPLPCTRHLGEKTELRVDLKGDRTTWLQVINRSSGVLTSVVFAVQMGSVASVHPPAGAFLRRTVTVVLVVVTVVGAELHAVVGREVFVTGVVTKVKAVESVSSVAAKVKSVC